jgi:lipopolysaccharide assembly outer membrane protein LptD (OstA)
VKPPSASSPVNAAGADIVQKDKAGAIVWRLKVAGSITGSEQAGAIQANDITFQTAAVKAGKAWSAKAASAYVSYGTSRITFTKGVKAQATDGSFAFTADHADYQMDTRKIIGEGNVKMTFPAGKATAERITVDTTRGEVRVHGIKGAYNF